MSTQIGTACPNRDGSAREVCEYFRLNLRDADEIIGDFRSIVSQWRTLATRLALPAREQERMADAFRLADD
ncbi:hypothetical protein [Burkholderia ubonensis]|uniref:hypothetical protein n=1 Tax=Burkholderia ubonensis TaxID=101571 RepID=UPI000AB0486D|nr:hypothetical protein [Burkholderia ubonensis]